jgi:hypothetical protein
MNIRALGNFGISRVNAGSAPTGARFSSSCIRVILVFGLLAGATANVLAAAKFVSGLVPDWNQPYHYPLAPPPSAGPGPDPAPNVANQWNAWCAPSSAANLAGHWTDALGVPVGDSFAFPATTNWPLAATWHDYQADGATRPPVPQPAAGALPAQTTDIGWYMDTNRGRPWDIGGGTMGGYFYGNGPHTGTYLKDIDVGLQMFLNNRYSLSGSIYWRTGTRGRPGPLGYAHGTDPTGAPAGAHPNEVSAFNEVKSEIDSGRTLILCFMYWNPSQVVTGVQQSGVLTNESAFGYTNYFMMTPGSTNAEDESWTSDTSGEGLGHAVTCVGYIPAGDPADPYKLTTPTDWVIVHDNWQTTPRNVAVPFGRKQPAGIGTFDPAWDANTTAVPWPTLAKFKKGFVPDWNQPYAYTANSANGGPGPDPNNGWQPFAPTDQWNDWCVPTSAANLAGHWADYHGVPVADSTAFPGSTKPWADPSWQDYLADGTELPAVPPGRPPPQPVLPATVTDIGWYMDTNLGVLYDDGSSFMGGFFFGDLPHPGTYLKNIHIGLANYLNSLYSNLYTNNANGCWNTGTRGKFFAAGLDPTGGVAQVHLVPATAFAEVTNEINRCHTVILSYKHWDVHAAGIDDVSAESTNSESAFGGSYYTWGPGTNSMTNAENEEWNFYDGSMSSNNLGHAVTAVGYIPAGDVLDPYRLTTPTDWVIVHDNWVSTPRNVIIPFDFANNWVANTIAYPDAGFLQIVGIGVLGGTNAVIRFTGIPGALHDLQWTSAMLSNTTWSTSVSNISCSAATMLASNATSGSVTNRFYRIKASY